VRFTQVSLDARWRFEWIWEGLWLIYYSIMLVVIGIIWRPNSDNTQYAYSELSQELSSENEIVLQPISVSFGDISKRSNSSTTILKSDEDHHDHQHSTTTTTTTNTTRSTHQQQQQEDDDLSSHVDLKMD
jgi:hypothetical protein